MAATLQGPERLASLVDAVLAMHSERKDGAQSLSFVSQELRYAGWRGASNLNELASTLKRQGYEVVNDKFKRFVRPKSKKASGYPGGEDQRELDNIELGDE